jgi:hypothetical protein
MGEPAGLIGDAEGLTSGRRRADLIDDPLTGDTAEARRLQPYEARKEYICPGCNQEIRAGTGHVVVVPLSATDMRRHWHERCLERARLHGLR